MQNIETAMGNRELSSKCWAGKQIVNTTQVPQELTPQNEIKNGFYKRKQCSRIKKKKNL